MSWQLFHFLRPGFLLLLLPAALIVFSIMRRQDPLRPWKKVIVPDLLEHLAINREQRQGRLRPVVLLAAAWLLGIVALSGPTWKKEATPFTEDQAALFIVMKVTPGMLAEDIQPSRLQRAAQKISDLLALRPGSKTGLIAYAGSAHLVMPLTSDPGVIRFFASELTPDVMPVEGDDPLQAIELAQSRLAASGLPGSIVMIADSIALPFAPADGADVHILAMAAGPEVVPPADSPPAPALNEDAMREAARGGGGKLVLVTADNEDIQKLNRQIESSIAAAPTQEGERWKDAGYGLMMVLLLVALPLWRKGGGVRLRA